MTRMLLLTTPIAAVALVGCDSSASSPATQGIGVCDGFRGRWLSDTVYIKDVGDFFDTVGIRTEIEFGSASFSLDSYGTYRRKTQLEQRLIGNLKDIGSSMLELTPDKVYGDDDETGEFTLSADPYDYLPDTLVYSFPGSGRMRLVEKGSSGGGIVLTCR